MNALSALTHTPTRVTLPPAPPAVKACPSAPRDSVSLSTRIQVTAVATVGGGLALGAPAAIGAACASAGAVAGTLGVLGTTVGLALLAGYAVGKDDHSASRMGGMLGLILGGVGGLVGSGCGAVFGWPGACVAAGAGIVGGGLVARGYLHHQQGARP